MNVILFNLGVDYSDDLPECIRFPTAVFTMKLSKVERRGILTEMYNIPQREYPKREPNMSCIFEDIKRRYLREGREEGLVEGRVEGRVEGKAEGIGEGKESAQIDSMLAIMSTLNLTVEEALDALKIPESERDHLKARIAQ